MSRPTFRDHAGRAASQFVRPDDIADSIPCGDDVGTFVEAVRAYAEAGFTEIALVQVGGDHQQHSLDWTEKSLRAHHVLVEVLAGAETEPEPPLAQLLHRHGLLSDHRKVVTHGGARHDTTRLKEVTPSRYGSTFLNGMQEENQVRQSASATRRCNRPKPPNVSELSPSSET